MSHKVFANTWQIAARSGMNKSIARFPDVCLSPPGPPAGPLPIPYADTSFSTDLKNGSKTVRIGGQPAALAQQSYYQPAVLGNEAATRSFGASVVTHQITGKTYFQAWSMDVKIEGRNVCRHLDLTTSNHGSDPGATPPAPTGEAQTLPATQAALQNKQCPCCGQPLHDWQKKDPMDPDSEALDTIPEDDFYARLARPFAKQADELRAAPAEMQKKLAEAELKPGHKDFKFIAAGQKPSIANVILAKEKFYREAAAELKALRDASPDCPNVAKNKDVGCGTHFDVPVGKHDFPGKVNGKPVALRKTYAQRCDDAFTENLRDQSFDRFESTHPNLQSVPRHRVQVNHKTPKQAGGCNEPGNTVPNPYVPHGMCVRIEQLQSVLQSTRE